MGLGAVFLVLLVLEVSQHSSSPGPSFQTAEVVRGTLESIVSSTGTLAAVETVDVGTEVSGTIEKVNADFNDRVQKGQILAILKQDILSAAVADVQASVTRAEADLKLAGRELQRNLPLYEKGFLSDQEFLPYRIDRDKARASLVSARANLEKARTNLNNTVIRSPIDGTIIKRSVDAGQTVAASLNTPTLFIIAKDLSRMQIEADVDETDIGRIRQGQEVRFSVQAYPEEAFSGRVRQVRLQPETVQNVVTYTVIVEAANTGGLLLPGMTATCDFVVERVDNALLVPNAALRFKPDEDLLAKGAGVEKTAAAGKTKGSRVFVLAQKGTLRGVPVITGSSDGQVIVILEGDLQAGAKVVTGIPPAAEKSSQGGFSLFRMMRGRRR
ncbi:MAG: efflux RND transporter periplasmic adaptor subunit [Deltaproteobacteria bacterium]|nr:efflux RND transporter periplasmic adaptor subunit [Deltaproteobacteria bacterium]